MRLFGFLSYTRVLMNLHSSTAFAISRMAVALSMAVFLSACQMVQTTWHRYMHKGSAEDAGAQLLDLFSGDGQEPIISDRFALPENSNVVGQIQLMQARYEDTLFDIARRYNLGIDELTEANPGVDRWLPGEGTPIVLPTRFVLPDAPRKGIVLNIASKRLFYYPDTAPLALPVVITHPIGIGRIGWSTPTGTTKVIAKTANPTWHVPKSVRAEHAALGDPLPEAVPPGPDNPLGKFALRLGMTSYLIHGTNKPNGVGLRVSHGCVRLYPEDIQLLYQSVPIGTPVTIVNQPYLVGSSEGELYLEAHRPLEDDQRNLVINLQTHLIEAARNYPGSDDTIDWEKVAQLIQDSRGFPVPVTQGSLDTETLVLTGRVIKKPPAIKQEINGFVPIKGIDLASMIHT